MVHLLDLRPRCLLYNLIILLFLNSTCYSYKIDKNIGIKIPPTSYLQVTVAISDCGSYCKAYLQRRSRVSECLQLCENTGMQDYNGPKNVLSHSSPELCCEKCQHIFGSMPPYFYNQDLKLLYEAVASIMIERKCIRYTMCEYPLRNTTLSLAFNTFIKEDTENNYLNEYKKDLQLCKSTEGMSFCPQSAHHLLTINCIRSNASEATYNDPKRILDIKNLNDRYAQKMSIRAIANLSYTTFPCNTDKFIYILETILSTINTLLIFGKTGNIDNLLQWCHFLQPCPNIDLVELLLVKRFRSLIQQTDIFRKDMTCNTNYNNTSVLKKIEMGEIISKSSPGTNRCSETSSKRSSHRTIRSVPCDTKLLNSTFPLENVVQPKIKQMIRINQFLNSVDTKLHPSITPETTETPVANSSNHESIPSQLKKTGSTNKFSHQYCIIGSGPGGLQLGYFLARANRDYVILERNNQSGSFYERYPRHRKLISINKQFTGRVNPEFNMRHDWNSLLSNDPRLLYKYFSEDFFPHADTMVSYLNAFSSLLSLNVKYNTDIRDLRRHSANKSVPSKTHKETSFFTMKDQHDQLYICRRVIVATGMWLPHTPKFPGHHLTEGYEDAQLNPSNFRGKTVLILGRGNAAFETADALYGVTSSVHLVSRSRARLAWSTHYVGDLRAVNNGLLDTYQLKSLDGLLEANVEDLILRKTRGKIEVLLPWDGSSNTSQDGNEDTLIYPEEDNFSLRDGYDHVIRCLGFKFDFSLFHKSTRQLPCPGHSKYPSIKQNFESTTLPGLFFVGAAAHSLDFRRSAGGFIHGFRYTAKALHRLLDWRYHQEEWPSSFHAYSDVLNVIVNRINQASGPYQMFGSLADIFLLERNGVVMLQEIPLPLIGRLGDVSGHTPEGSLLLLVMEYGENFSGPGKDPFRADRAAGDVLEAHRSNFLHPVLYYYKTSPDELTMLFKWSKLTLPRPDKIHHVLEDFLTDWTAQQSHIFPLRRFLETIISQELTQHYAQDCLLQSITSMHLPPHCEDISHSSYFIPNRS